MPTLLDTQFVAVWIAGIVQPCAFVSAVRINDEGVVVFPAADRVAVPPRVRIGWKPPASGPGRSPPSFPHEESHNGLRRVQELYVAELEQQLARVAARITQD